jgi:N-acetylglutamate synthase-like GNAT family acetyltransferase
MADKYQIISLRERPEFADDCAAWSYGEWATQYHMRTLAETLERYRKTASGNELPQTWLAVADDKAAGMISLKINDHPDFPELSPWLASLFVHPYHRGQGIAEQLIKRCETEAKQIYGFTKMYLFTPNSAALYARLGWQKVRMIRDPMGIKAEGDVLMMKELV